MSTIQRRSLFRAVIFSLAAMLIVSCGGGGGGVGDGGGSGHRIIVSVSADQESVPAGGTAAVTANVWNDDAQRGVTWTVTCPAEPCGSVSPATSASGISATYTAPSISLAADKTITIKATSATDAARTGSKTITLAAILVTIDPPETTVEAATTRALTANVENDPALGGVTWTIAPESGAGTLSNPTSTSVTYVAPVAAPASDVIVTITATSITDATHSGISTITLLSPALVIDPTYATLDAGGTQVFTASVQHDPAQPDLNVTWQIEPESGAGTLSDATSTTVTYHAPATPPASDLEAIISAASIATPTLSATANLTVSAVTLSIDPGSALVPVGTPQAFTVTTGHDPQDLGVSWQLVQSGQACAPACGTLDSSTARSAVYRAPTAVPASPEVKIAATSLTDASKSIEATIAVSAGVLSLVPTALNFGTVKALFGSKRLRTFLTNTGGARVTISKIEITGPGAANYTQNNNCGSAIAAQIKCNIDVDFRPGISNNYAATLEITDSDLGSPQHVALTGSGFANQERMSLIARAAQFDRLRVPPPAGSQKVGTRVLQLTDAARTDPLLADGSKRELAVRFWYPAATAAACRAAPYASPAVWNYLGELTGSRLPTVATNSCLDAPIADGVYPVVVFSHGLTGTFTDYTFLSEDLASRGYFVASVDHSHEATAVELAGGRIAKSLYGSHLTRIENLDESSARQLELTRVKDMRFVVNELQRLENEPDSPFLGHLDTTAIAVAGHSLGGLTALEELQLDPRVRAAVVLDGVLPNSTFGVTEKPVMFVDAGRVQWSADQLGTWQKLRGPKLAVNLRNAGHLAPSDAVWLARGAVKTGELSPERAISEIRNYVAAFLDVHLRGRPADQLLRQRSPADPTVELTLQQEGAP